jgi:dihydrofolate reductase
MPTLRVHSIAMSLDGYAAGPGQDREHPLGVGGNRLHTWAFATRSQRKMMGLDGGETGADDDFIARGDENVGATIMGRNMFGPIRGEWGDEDWRGWWGPEPPYHHPVYVLTHHPHEPIEMEGGTTFHFVDDGIEPALEQALAAAGGADVRIGGGPATIQQYLRAGLVDSLHVAVVPTLLGGGERLFVDDLGSLGYEVVEHVPSASVTHVVLARQGG